MPKVGGTGDLREPDENVHQVTREVKDHVETKTGLQFEEFTPINYRSQLVNGTNYFIKVRHAPEQHLHLRVHRSFNGEVTLSAVQLDKKLEDELEYFQ
ncbi:hypothetical protein JTE90_004634 [Oedothorax gibbosus]|uniref:Cystatin domain-containing protein n=1 Tax=Oedothorax gibbosus TaxID=931172 RepID=A0AAV6URR1_9ARAC|nr:hypothetical protein JTE90_004634 [Oedothorax gibbosus]